MSETHPRILPNNPQLRALLMPIAVMVCLALFSFIVVMLAVHWFEDDLSTDKWSALEAITTAGAFSLAVGGVVGALLQFHRANEDRAKANDDRAMSFFRDFFCDIYSRVMDKDQIAARRYIYQKLTEYEGTEARVRFVQQHPEAQDHIKTVLNQLDYIGFVVKKEWADSDDLVDWMSPIVVKVWGVIGPLVEYEVAQRPEEPDYYIAARDLAATCQAWRDKHYPQRAEITYSNDHL
ncbi:MAG: hypothetical protein GYB65_08920 [Chloroflexi bacterium]|nr:hypothetical protein [Chloroflexota bacterium]